MRISDGSSDGCSSDLEVDAKWKADTLDAKWSAIRSAGEEVTEAIEPLRREKTIRSSLEAEASMGDIAEAENIDFAEICIVAKVDIQPGSEGVCVKPSDYHKIGRASCRERGCPYVWITVVAGKLKNKRCTQNRHN